MDDRRRRQAVGEHYHQEAPRTPTRSQSRKPPSGFWQPTVPSWEKKFCISVGSVPWGKLLEAKKLMSYYNNVLQWDDSAGKEAFNNAKNRYWAQINGLPCDISLPDPDIYIDIVDWNPDIDPELLLDLERELEPPDEDDKEGKSKLIGDSLFFLNRPVPCSGWGDAEEDQARQVPCTGWGDADDNQERKVSCTGWDVAEVGEVRPVPCTGWDDAEEDQVKTVEDSLKPELQDFSKNLNSSNHHWDSAQGDNTLKSYNNTWGDHGANSWESNQWEIGNNNNNNNYNWEISESKGTGNFGGGWKRDNPSQYMSRYRTSRFQGAEHQTDHGWKYGRGRKRVNFFCERPHGDEKPLGSQQWNSSMHSCGPISHGCREGGNPWSWEKPVS